jgi:hypothetical protein
MNNRSYVIINASEVASVDFDSVMENADTLRYSVDGSKTFVKFAGETPSGLEGKTIYNHDEIRTLLATEEWTNPEPES